MQVSIADRQRKRSLPLPRLDRESRKILSALGLQGAELGIVIAGRGTVRRLNRDYRGVDSTTDVLSFPLNDFKGRPALYRKAASSAHDSPGGVLLLGDVVIDAERAEKQARELGHCLGDELMRLIIHGVLHLLGYDHERGLEEARRMKRAEDRVVRSLYGRTP